MNTFGNNFRVSIFGESHGKTMGITLDNVPPGIDIEKFSWQKSQDKK